MAMVIVRFSPEYRMLSALLRISFIWLIMSGSYCLADKPYKNVRLISLHTDQEDQRIIRIYSQPALQTGHTAELLCNGKVCQSPLYTEYFLLHNLSRGHHKVRARILDQKGRPVALSPRLMINISH